MSNTTRERHEHTPIRVREVPHSHQYASKNHSAAFVCPTCGASQRQNLNRLGGGFALICGGEKWARVPTWLWQHAETRVLSAADIDRLVFEWRTHGERTAEELVRAALAKAGVQP